MALSQDQIELEARLQAIEYLVCTLLADRVRHSDALDQMIEKHKAELQSMVIPGLDAALSDAASAEYGQEVLRLLSAAKKFLPESQKS